MSIDWRTIRGHTLVVLAVVAGIVGSGIAFNGMLDHSLKEVTQGVPLLLVGLWWAGRGLGMSMLANPARRGPAKRQPGSRRDKRPE